MRLVIVFCILLSLLNPSGVIRVNACDYGIPLGEKEVGILTIMSLDGMIEEESQFENPKVGASCESIEDLYKANGNSYILNNELFSISRIEDSIQINRQEFSDVSSNFSSYDVEVLGYSEELIFLQNYDILAYQQNLNFSLNYGVSRQSFSSWDQVGLIGFSSNDSIEFGLIVSGPSVQYIRSFQDGSVYASHFVSNGDSEKYVVLRYDVATEETTLIFEDKIGPSGNIGIANNNYSVLIPSQNENMSMMVYDHLNPNESYYAPLPSDLQNEDEFYFERIIDNEYIVVFSNGYSIENIAKYSILNGEKLTNLDGSVIDSYARTIILDDFIVMTSRKNIDASFILIPLSSMIITILCVLFLKRRINSRKI